MTVALKRLLNRSLGITLLGAQPAPSVYLHSGLRLIGVPGNAPDAEIDREIGRLENMRRLSPKRAATIAVPIGWDERFALERDEIDAAIDRIRSPAGRLLARLFWPPAGEDQIAHFRAGITGPAFVASHESSAQASDEVLARPSGHALAIAFHNRAIAWELDRITGSAAADGPTWDLALARWGTLFSDAGFFDELGETLRATGATRAVRESRDELCRNLSRFVLGFNVAFGRFYATRGDSEDCLRHMGYVEASGFNEDVRAEAIAALRAALLEAQIAPMLSRLRTALKGQDEPYPRSVLQACCDALVEDLARVVGESASDAGFDVSSGSLDEVAKAIWEAAESLKFQGDDRERTLLYNCVLLRRLRELPVSAELRRRIDESRRGSASALYADLDASGRDPADCFFADGCLADPDASIVVPMHRQTGREVIVDRSRGTAGVSVSFATLKLVVPRSREAAECHAGKTVRRVPTDERRQTLERELAELEEAHRTRLDEIAEEEQRIRRECIDEVARRTAGMREAHDRYLTEFEQDRAERVAGIDTELEQLEASAREELDALARGHAVLRSRLHEATARALRRVGHIGGWLTREAPLTIVGLLGIAFIGPYMFGTAYLAEVHHVLVWWTAMMSSVLLVGHAQRRLGARRAAMTATRATGRYEADVAAATGRHGTRRRAVAARRTSVQKEKPLNLTERRDRVRKEVEASKASSREELATRREALVEKHASDENKVRDRLSSIIKARAEHKKRDFPVFGLARRAGFKDGAKPTKADMQMTTAEEAEAVRRFQGSPW